MFKSLTRGVLPIVVLTCGMVGCSSDAPVPRAAKILAVTHSALNRLTLYDPAQKKIVGALPAQKLPHDMLLSRDGKTLFVVNSGSQCMTMYHLDSPEFWRYAAAFMQKDSANLFAPRHPSGGSMFGSSGETSSGTDYALRNVPPSPGDSIFLNKDPVQSLPSSVAQFVLTDGRFPEIAETKHREAGAFGHKACYDCHDRSLGGKPFGPAYSKDSSSIYLVHLGYKNIAVLDSKTLAPVRTIPLALPANLSPVEVWLHPDGTTAFVTCRNEIGMSLPGVIQVVDLGSGKVLKSIRAGIYPWHLLADPAGRKLYVNNFQSSRISVVDIGRREIVDSIIVQNGPSMMKWLDRGTRLAVSCFYTDKLLIVDPSTGKVEHEVSVDGNPTTIGEDPQDGSLLVLCGGSGLLDRIDRSSWGVVSRDKMLFGAYAFLPLEIERTL